MPVALVTGANEGIGYYIVKGLALQGWEVVLGGRDLARLQQAMAKLQQELGNSTSASEPTATTTARLSVALVDLTDTSSIHACGQQLKAKYPAGLDALVNNAAMAYKVDAKEPFGLQAKDTLGCNYFGTLAVCETFIPLLNPQGGKVVSVSSRAGNFNALSSELKAKLLHPKLTIPELSQMMKQFIELAAKGTHTQAGWPDTAYGTSKIGVTVLTRLLARDYPSLVVTACCPGWCRTDMAGMEAPRTAEEGADTPVWLVAAAARAEVSSEFYAERSLVKI